MLSEVVRCAYCEAEATMRIVSNPEQVCYQHAMEFWTGLLGYARDHSDPCVKDEPSCACWSCQELTASHLRDIGIAESDEQANASCIRAIAIAAAGPPPTKYELSFNIGHPLTADSCDISLNFLTAVPAGNPREEEQSVC
jgi:hypothetical protein